MNRILKKITANILVVVLFMSSIQGGQILWAAEETTPLGFNVSRKMLKEGNKGLSIEERDNESDETALAEWDAGAAGKYLLQYYVEADTGSGTSTKKVAVVVDTTDVTNIKADISVNTVGGSADLLNYDERVFNNATNSWTNKGTPVMAQANIIKENMLLGNSADREKQEFNVVITNISFTNQANQSENLKIRMKFVDNKVYMFTNGIKKGNITPFKLFYSNSGTFGEPKITQEIFNGPKQYKIQPTHLSKKTNGTIEDIGLIRDINEVKPGSVPGIKLSFEQIKMIKASDEKFTAVDQLPAEQQKKVIIDIGTRYSLDSVSNSQRLDFLPREGEPVEINMTSTVENAVYVDNDIVTIYLSSEDIQTPENHKSILWDKLATSTIVDASFQYGSLPEKYWPNNKGYTYLYYNINKTSTEQVQLNITPYNINTRATYSVYILSTEDTNKGTPQLVYEYDPAKTEASNITIPAPAHVPCYFQIVAEIDNNKYESQMVFYDPARQEASPAVTRITSIDNIFVVPSDELNGDPKAIGFDITWEAPDDLRNVLAKGDLYYELLMRRDKNEHDPLEYDGNGDSSNYAVYSKVFKVSLDGNKVCVTPQEGSAGKGKAPDERYSEVNNTFKMENVSLKNFGKDAWEKINIIENHLDNKSGDYLGTIAGKAEDTLTGCVIPGNYYFSFRTVFVANDTEKPISYSDESNLVSVALNNTTEIIPVPEKITVEKEVKDSNGIISETLNIINVNIQNYVMKMLEPSQLYLYTDDAKTQGRFSGTYEVYFYQSEENLNDPNAYIKVGKVNEDEPLDIIGTKYINELRAGKIIVLEIPGDTLLGSGSQSFTIKGLDPNQVYYLKARLRLDPWRDTPGDTEPRYSNDSKVFTFTTSTEPIPPSDDEKVPTAPEKIWLKNPIDQNSSTLVKPPTAVIGWSPTTGDITEDETVSKIYYEFIRTEKELTEDEKAKAVKELVDADSTRVGFKSESVTGTTSTMSTYLDGKWQDMVPAQDPSAFELTDNTLQTNKIYYYYVRTVCVYNNHNNSPVASSWIMVPVTTTPITKPINLKIETEKYEYDEKTEAVISFDVALPEGAKIGTDYNFDIAIKGEDDTEYQLSKYKASLYTSTNNNPGTPESHIHVVYKISDLKPNMRYNIKVRTVDMKEKDDKGNYVTSLYTDPVSTRTDYDEEQAEKDEKYDKYLQIFDQQAEKLRRKVYWTVEDEEIYKYRNAYMSTDIAGQREYNLVVENDKSASYYLPAAVIKKANEENVTLNIVIDKYTASIRPYTLTEETSEVEKALDKIAINSIEDYYVAITFKTINTSAIVNGETPISPELDIEMSVIYLDKEDERIESDIEVELDKIIKEERTDFIKNLEKKLKKDNISDDTLNELVDEAMKNIEKAHQKKVKKILDKAKDRTVRITAIEKPVLLTAEIEGFAANGYYKSGGWFNVEVYASGSTFYIEADKLGVYIMTGQKSLIDTVPSLAPYQSFIAKYGLTDFFTLDSYMIKTAVTKEQLYGAVARIMGATRGSDYTVYLQNQKIAGVNKIGIKNPVRQDQAIYIVMQGYEAIHHRKVNSIMIKNKQSVSNIGAFQPVYRDYVYAAVELKIIDNPGSKVIPSKQMTVEEVIKILYKMQTS